MILMGLAVSAWAGIDADAASASTARCSRRRRREGRTARLLRLRRLLAAHLALAAHGRPPAAAFIAAGQRDAEQGHADDTLGLYAASGRAPVGFRVC